SLLEISHDHLLGVRIGLGAGEPELPRRPQAEHLVAARGRLELELLVDRELLLETFLALVERGHACLAVSGAPRADALASRLRSQTVRSQHSPPRFRAGDCDTHPPASTCRLA